jgi:hypothetical protein
MTRVLVSLLLLASLLHLSGCAREEKAEGQPLATINDYALTVDEFHAQLAAELKMDEDFKVTEAAKDQFLEGLIRKELLIQEAKRRKLDRKEKFVNAIERYWESTLIRDLMEAKGAEIEKNTIVSQEEIESRYEAMKKEDPQLPPFEDMQEGLAEKILEQKKQRRLEKWIDALRDEANVQINRDLLSGNEP